MTARVAQTARWLAFAIARLWKAALGVVRGFPTWFAAWLLLLAVAEAVDSTRGLVVLAIIAVLLLAWAAVSPSSWDQLVARPSRHRKTARFIRKSWPTMALRCGLSTPGPDQERTASPLVRRRPLSWEGDRLAVRIELVIGQTIEDVLNAADRLAAAAGARTVTVQPTPKGACVWFRFGDPLQSMFDAKLPSATSAPDASRVVMGRQEEGGEFAMPLGPQTLLVGSSGSGKASLIWSFAAGLAPAIASGLVEINAVDLKGGMELSMGEPLFTRFARTPEEAVTVLEDAVAAMQQRAGRLSGITRQHKASVDEPLVVVLIDELAAVTAYLTDRDLKTRAALAIGLLCSQGRAVGYMMFGALQDPRKETLPSRGLFTQTIGLRLKDAEETRMVLGEGASAAGARCHKIPRTMPGVGYAVPEDGGPPVRFRAGYVDDDAIRYLAQEFPAPRQVPITVTAPTPRATGRARSRVQGEEVA
jgi:S-DNA-T family DNA segregation ATPase FtsK/SpoIIIE